jgi:hypothetical protein
MADERPEVDDRDPADAVAQTVAHVLQLAETWGAWDGHPFPIDDRIYTPHKAVRRTADHLLDHLAQLEAHVAGAEPLADRWHGSYITTASDLAPFGPDDLDEARSRLERLAELWRIRLAAITPDELDQAKGDAYTPREMAFCAAGSTHYADAVGRLPKDRTANQ